MTFTVDVCLVEEWLANALERARAGKFCRVTFVILGAVAETKYKVRAVGGGKAECIVVSIAGDYTQDPMWKSQF